MASGAIRRRPASTGDGKSSSPAATAWLYGFEAKTGKLLWKFDCNPKGADFKAGGRGTRNYIVSAPVVWDNKALRRHRPPSR